MLFSVLKKRIAIDADLNLDSRLEKIAIFVNFKY